MHLLSHLIFPFVTVILFHSNYISLSLFYRMCSFQIMQTAILAVVNREKEKDCLPCPPSLTPHILAKQTHWRVRPAVVFIYSGYCCCFLIEWDYVADRRLILPKLKRMRSFYEPLVINVTYRQKTVVPKSQPQRPRTRWELVCKPCTLKKHKWD